MHQWQAHKTTITSIGGGNFRAKLDLLITAGDDCYVHVWTSVGAHVGTFGQVLRRQLCTVDETRII